MDERQKRHFAALRTKYQVSLLQGCASDNFLYLILRKAELGIQITDLELKWLTENRFFRTIELISLQQYQREDFNRLESEFLNLRTKYKIPENLDLAMADSVYSVLWKLEFGILPTDLEIELLDQHNLVEVTRLIRDIVTFANLKTRYKATQHIDSLPHEPLFTILKKLDARDPLSDSEANWLLVHDFRETLEFYQQQENERLAIAEFAELKAKYHVESCPDTYFSSPLYAILKKLEGKRELTSNDCKWLEQQQLTQLTAIARQYQDISLFKELKVKYKATRYQDADPSSPLFLILKNIESVVSETDIQWLTSEGLSQTAEIAKSAHFRILKRKYQIVGQIPVDPFYEIMLKLERGERLDPKQVIQLIEEGFLSRHGKIVSAYHRLEAIFYEQDYQRTGNRWSLPSASSHWRKADEPENALKATENVNWNKVQDPDLKAALLVTRGAAFRDLSQLSDAETCATQAKDCRPESHQPYTLLGSICYDQGRYMQGDHWFEMAIKRGANDTDDEIEKVVRMTKDKNKRREVSTYLLSKDPVRYHWASSYLK